MLFSNPKLADRCFTLELALCVNEEDSIHYKELASKIMNGEYVCDIPTNMWVTAIRYMIGNIEIFPFDVDKMHMLWIVNGGHIRRQVSNDQLNN